MAQPRGDRIGHYEVQSLLGKGGMGEVYRAYDPKLNRDVAIKVLPAALANDADYLARFQREAQTLAALNHPNIAAIYGLEGSAIVMELVEGETLKGPLPLAEALPLARQIAEALEAAHEKGIIHRDLKPGNVKVTPDGVVKVLDFGLAKAVNERPVSTGPDSPTLTMRATEAGLILGTAGYMSPEQAAGKNVDRRADIWSFGVVLYELLTGKRLFDGETVTHTLADVVRAPIDLSGLPLRDLLERCLDRNIKTRLQHIGEARIAIETYRETPKAKAVGKHNWLLTAALVTIAAGAAWWLGAHRSASEPKQVFHVDVDLGAEAQLDIGTSGPNFALSADGRRIAYVVKGPNDGTLLATRTLDQDQVTLLPGTENARTPFLSPDGAWVAFVSGGMLKKASVAGGGTFSLCEARVFRGGVWTDDGNLVVSLSTQGGLGILPASGGTPRPLTKLLGEERSHRWPAYGPGGAILFISGATAQSYEEAVIEAVWPKTGQRTVVHKGGYAPQYAPSGHLLFMSQGTLMAAPLDREKLTLLADPAGLRTNVEANAGGGSANLQLSAGGMLLFVKGAANANLGFSWVDAAGNTEPTDIPPGNYRGSTLSPDHKRIALFDLSGALSVFDLERKTLSRLATGLGIRIGGPVWSPNGKLIFYHTNSGIFAIPHDGSRQPLQLTKDAADRPISLPPDSSLLYFRRRREVRSLELDWADPLRPTVRKEGKAPIEAGGGRFLFSTDGRWIAHSQDGRGERAGVYVQANDTKAGGRWQISNEGARDMQWSPNGRELLYQGADMRVHIVPFTVSGDAFVAGKARIWPTPGQQSFPTFDTDGTRLLYPTRRDERDERRSLTLESDFAESLLGRKELAPK